MGRRRPDHAACPSRRANDRHPQAGARPRQLDLARLDERRGHLLVLWAAAGIDRHKVRAAAIDARELRPLYLWLGVPSLAARDRRYSYYTVVGMARRSPIPKSQPFSIRLGEQAGLLVRDEVRRTGRSRSVVVEELAEEAAKTRLFPGVAFRGTPRRAWVIGTGLDVWEIVELLRSYEDDERRLRAAHPLVGERHLRLAGAYAARFPDEIAAFAEDARRPLDELRRSYPFLHTAE